MSLLRKIAVLFLAIIMTAVMPVAGQAKPGGSGGIGKNSNAPKPSKSNNATKPDKKQVDQPQKPAEKIDVNSASAAQLATLPGITDEIAKKIIAARPFKSVSDLKGKKILTDAQYNAIKDLATANKPAAPAKPQASPAPASQNSGE